MSKTWKLRPHNDDLERSLLESGQEPIMARLLSQRNITPDVVRDFFDANLSELENYKPLGGTPEAAQMLIDLAKEKKGVCILGDYDADGVMSTAMMVFICRKLGIPYHVFIPDRFKHGYGLNPKSVEAFNQDVQATNPGLIIALDCGTSSENEMKILKQSGAKILVIDHHIPNEGQKSISADILINWRLCGGSEMCTAGQVLMLAKAIDNLSKTSLFTELLPMAAIGTVADISPIVWENRIIVRNGLSRAGNSPSLGLRMIVESMYLGDVEVSQSDVSFRIAPRINSAGRVQKAELAYRLMVEEDIGSAGALLNEIENLNMERRELCSKITEEAIEQARKQSFKNGLMLINPEWHIGVVGIVASRIVEEFGVPALVMGSSKGMVKGSGRSLDGINIKAVLDSCSELFDVYGGHEMAVGASLKSESLSIAPQKFDEACGKYYEKNGRPDFSQYYDIDLHPNSVRILIPKMLKDNLFPYCDQHNPEPIFKLWGVKVTNCSITNRDGWRRVTYTIESLEGRRIPMKLVTFDESYGPGLIDKTIDVFFKFPQMINTKWEPSLELIDIVYAGDKKDLL